MLSFIIGLFLVFCVLSFIMVLGGKREIDREQALYLFFFSIAAVVLLLIFGK